VKLLVIIFLAPIKIYFSVKKINQSYAVLIIVSFSIRTPKDGNVTLNVIKKQQCLDNIAEEIKYCEAWNYTPEISYKFR